MFLKSMACCCTSPEAGSVHAPISKVQQRAAVITLIVACLLAALTVASAYTNFTNPGALPGQAELGLNAFATQMFLGATLFATLLSAVLFSCRWKAPAAVQTGEEHPLLPEIGEAHTSPLPPPPKSGLSADIPPPSASASASSSSSSSATVTVTPPSSTPDPVIAPVLTTPSPTPAPAAVASASATPTPPVTQLTPKQTEGLKKAITAKDSNRIQNTLDGVTNSDLVIDAQTRTTAFHQVAVDYQGAKVKSPVQTQDDEEALARLALNALKQHATPDAINALNSEGETPLHTAERLNKPLIQSALMNAGANPKTPDRQGKPPQLLPVPHAPSPVPKTAAAAAAAKK